MTISIESEADVVIVRQRAYRLAELLGFVSAVAFFATVSTIATMMRLAF